MTSVLATVPAPVLATDILVVLHDFALGGTERTALRLAGAWAQAGRSVRLLCGDPRGPAAAWLHPAVTLVRCAPPVPRGPGARTRLARAAAAELALRPAGLLFVPGNHHWPVIAAAAALDPARRPLIVAQVSNPVDRPDRGAVRRALGRARACRRLAGADALVTLTAAQARDADLLLGRSLARHIPLAVLDDADRPPRPPPAGPPVVLCLGRLVAQKRFDLALRAFAAAAVPEARLAFVGEGPRRRALAASARRLGVADRVTFAGTVAEVRDRLDAARVLLAPSDFEGYGAVVVEALAAGRPVVATDRTPAAVELVDRPQRGAVVPAGDVGALARALRKVLTGPWSEPAAAETLDRFRLGPVAAAYLALFDELAARRTGVPGPPG